jgi:hypothetical protein
MMSINELVTYQAIQTEVRGGLRESVVIAEH